MSKKFKFKRGDEANLPTLDLAEPGFSIDSEKLFIGGSNGNVEMAKKSDITAINNNLANIETDLGEKATKTDVGSISDLTTTDKTSIVKAINYTYNALGNKASQLEVDNISTSLAEKAAQSDLNTTNANVALKANQTDLNTQKSRIDTIVTSAGNYYMKCLSTDTGALLVVSSSATTGQINLASVTPKLDTYTPTAGDYVRLVSNGLTAETIDIRTGADGVAYGSAGVAVRTQLTNLNNVFNSNDMANLVNKNNMYNIATDVTNTGVTNTTFTNTLVNGINQYGMNVTGTPSGIAAFTFTSRNTTFTNPIAIVLDFTRSAVSSFFLRLRFKDSSGNQINSTSNEYFYYSGSSLSGSFVVTSSAYPNAVSVDIVQFGTGNSTVCNYTFTNFRIYNLSDYNISTNTIKMQVNALQNITPYNVSKKATIMFDFDEISLDNRQTLMKQYGFKANFNANMVNGLDANIKTAIKSLANDGHCFNLYGGYGTKPTDYVNDVTGWQNYIGAGLSELQKVGIYYPVMYACSGMQSGTAVNTACQNLGMKYVRAAFGLTSGGTVYYNGSPNTNNNLNIWAYTLPTRTYTDIKAQIDSAVSAGSLCILFTHNVTDTGSDNDVSLSIFTQVLDYVKSLRDAGTINVLNIHDYWNVYNPVQGSRDDLKRIMSAITNLY